MSTTAEPHRTPRVPDFELTLNELRAVTGFNVDCARRVIAVFDSECPHDRRPIEALNDAAAFVDGGNRTRALRVSAVAAHRAARDVAGPAAHAAMAAGDAAASAYLHPLADAAQVGHILRGPAHCVRALETQPVRPVPHEEAIATVLDCATSQLIEVLRRYPRVSAGRTGASMVMGELDRRLRDMLGRLKNSA
ncbi:MAG TPA: hypothetical protein H9902_03255 [Candidatus Stackebrandtia faecavium]|nr:hypothetical protein [Candidatus Stackebrandtia faecavium]